MDLGQRRDETSAGKLLSQNFENIQQDGKINRKDRREDGGEFQCRIYGLARAVREYLPDGEHYSNFQRIVASVSNFNSFQYCFLR